MKKIKHARRIKRLCRPLTKHSASFDKSMMVAIQNSLDGIADALYGIAESLDYVAATSESADVCKKPTERESAIMFEALKNDFMRQMEAIPTESEHIAAMQRISRLSKGGMHE